MSNQIPSSYPEDQSWYSQPMAYYPNIDGSGRPPQPQMDGPQQTPASPYPNGQNMYPPQPQMDGPQQTPASPYSNGQNMYPPQQQGYAPNIPYAAPPVPLIVYQLPAVLYAPPPTPGAYMPYPQAPYGRTDPHSQEATTGLALGIATVLMCIIPFVGTFVSFICGILGIIFSALGRHSTTQKTTATIGLVLSILGLIISVLVFLVLLNALYAS